MDSPLIPSGKARWLVNQLIKEGIPSERILSGTRLTTGWVKDTDAVISRAQYRRVIENALDITVEPSLGLRLGQNIDLHEFGVLGYAIMSSATFGDALGFILKFWELNGALVKAILRKEGDISTLEIVPTFLFGSERIEIFAIEEWLSACTKAGSMLINRPVPLDEICFMYPEPEYTSLYRKIFQCPVFFSQKANRVKMPTWPLDLAINAAQPQITRFCREICDRMLLKLKGEDELIEAIRTFTLTTPGTIPTLEEMAARLDLSPRTLRRKLLKRETSYHEIRDKARADLAMEYLVKTNLGIDQISDIMGYTETSAFRRAFKKWIGQSPTKFRKKNRGHA